MTTDKITATPDEIVEAILRIAHPATPYEHIPFKENAVVNIQQIIQALSTLPRYDEREVLMEFIEWMYLVYGTPLDEKTIDTYLAEKEGGHEKHEQQKSNP